jgi:DNA repair protein SbcD/Mre11
MKFAHLADCHLGGWRQPELQKLNLDSFRVAIENCINEPVEFVLISGDLFDSAFPPIEILKETFSEFRKLKDAGIKVYLIAGSHDFSVSGKTFLDVLEKAGFCEICKSEENELTKIITLKPIIHKSYHIYGYPGKKSGLEVQDLKKININEPYSANFRILMLHTSITEALGSIPMESIRLAELPKADYYALGHIHIEFESEVSGKPAVYAGPTFPNNFKELEDMKYGSFYIIDVGGFTKVTRKQIKLKEVELISIEINDSLTGTKKIIEELEKRPLAGKIVLLKIFGNLKQGKLSDIKFQEIEDYLKKKDIYSFLKNTSRLEVEKQDIQLQIPANEMEKVEEVLINKYEKENPSDFNDKIIPLMDILSYEKQEGEKSQIFESRLITSINKLFSLEIQC